MLCAIEPSLRIEEAFGLLTKKERSLLVVENRADAMGSILLLGLLIGMKHAVEADHVAAVASLAGRNQSLHDALRMGLAWGLGHTAAIFAVGAVVLSLDTVLPERIALILEFGVGIMLVWLGVNVIRRLIKARIHFHAHRHFDGTQHFHAHSHVKEGAHNRQCHDHEHRRAIPLRALFPCGMAGSAALILLEGAHNRQCHDHEHRRAIPLRALVVGLMHGMAGSAALIRHFLVDSAKVLTLGEIDSLWMALAYMALFGLGSMLGMAALSIIIAVPLQRMAKHLTWAHSSLNALVGMLTIGIGAWVMYSAGVVDGLLYG